ncbi:MAG: zf-TFIIB domain-containing protein [Gemmatimonadota bacterium]|nr:zf-TFIIB domain-containing protein [Gemmatimonadota bacterium]
MRCGGELALAPHGLPICASCQAEIRASREQTRTCPVDNHPLSKEVVWNVVLDRCAECGGIWFDEGELRLLLHGREIEGFLEGFAKHVT